MFNYLKCSNINILVSGCCGKFFQCSVNWLVVLSVFNIANITISFAFDWAVFVTVGEIENSKLSASFL